MPGKRPTQVNLSPGPVSRGSVSEGIAIASNFRFQNKIRTDRPHIHLGALETIDSFLGLADDWLILIEAGVENHRNTRLPLESLNQIVVERVLLASHGLQ